MQKVKNFKVPSAYTGKFDITKDGSESVQVVATGWFNASDLRFMAERLLKQAKKLEKQES